MKPRISTTTRRGFTLIETLVAVLLLTTAIAGPLTIAAKGLSAALVARDQMTAFYLAQDAVEYVRFVRDSNKLGGAAWLEGLAACAGADGCYIDTLTSDVAVCSGACTAIQKYDDSGAVYYSYTQGVRTPQNFVRTITLSTADAGATETVLTVTVSWRAQSGATRSVVVRENLFNWQ